MQIIKTGATRYVILTRNFACKIPAPSSWRNFLWGLLANLQERDFWTVRWPELAPVLFAAPLGLLVIMPRVTVLTRAEFERFDYHAFIQRPDGSRVPVEAKPDSFGWLDGRVVAIDYGS